MIVEVNYKSPKGVAADSPVAQAPDSRRDSHPLE